MSVDQDGGHPRAIADHQYGPCSTVQPAARRDHQQADRQLGGRDGRCHDAAGGQRPDQRRHPERGGGALSDRPHPPTHPASSAGPPRPPTGSGRASAAGPSTGVSTVRLAPTAPPAASPGRCRPEAITAVIISAGSAPASRNAAAKTVILSPRAAAAAFSVNSSAPAISITADTASSPSPTTMLPP